MEKEDVNIMRRIVVFCSNPVDGGTAKVFAEMSKTCKILGMNRNSKIIPCINIGNRVKVYDTIEDLQRIDVYSEDEICGKLEEEKNIAYRFIRRAYRNFKYFKQKRVNIENMRQYLKKNKIHTVLIHNGGYIGDDLCNQMLEAAYMENIPMRIMVFHNDFPKNKIQKVICKKYDYRLCKYVTKIETVSEFTRNRILRNSYIKKDIGVIYNGISDINILSDEEKKKNINYNKDVYNIGMIGNFMSNKGQLHLIKAAKLLRENINYNFTITIIGNIYDEEYFKECCNYIYKNNLKKNIKIFHGIYNADEYTNLFKYTVVPSLEDESFGLISVESMKSGVPVIAYACGGIPEVVVDKRNGIIVDVGNIESLAYAMCMLMKNEAFRKKLGRQAKEDYMEKFAINVMAERYLDVMEIVEGSENE